MSDKSMNRLQFENDLEHGFYNTEASGHLPKPLPSPLNLNLGCGKDVKEGFVNIDLYGDDPRVVAMDIRDLNLPDNSADMILASDVLEHFSHRQIDLVLKEWARVLKPGGEIVVRCPSLRLQVKAYTSGQWNADIASYMIFGGQTNPGDYHCVAFDEASIRHHFTSAGFEVVDFEELDLPQSNGYINLNMTVKAVKKHVESAVIREEKKETLPDMQNDNILPSSLSEFAGLSFEVPPLPSQDSSPQLNIVWEGSQFVYHSLALINREHCANLLDTGLANVNIVPYEDDQFKPEGNEKYQRIYENDIRHKKDVNDDVSKLPYVWIRHQWPPKAMPPDGAKWIIMQPWEFTSLRKDFVEIFNQADEIWTPSNFSRKSFVDSGIDFDKVQVIPNGIDPELFKPDGYKMPLNTKKTFKFLFVGGTIFRKGIDILLRSFISSFSKEDDVCLVIKDMGGDSFYKNMNAKNNILEIQKQPDAPEILYMDNYLSEEDMVSLYRACDIFVCPYRGEGFSLPTLEAMACGLPVIVTEGGATDDFVKEEFGWKIPAQPTSVGNDIDGTELVNEGFLLEPNEADLTEMLKSIHMNPNDILSKGMRASAQARKYWTWKRATMKVLLRLDSLYDTDLALQAKDSMTESEDNYIKAGFAETEFAYKNYDDAKEMFEEALTGELSARYKVHALNRLAYIAMESGKNADTSTLIEHAEHVYKEHPDTEYLKTKQYFNNEKYVEALETVTPLMENWKDLKLISSSGIALDDLLCLTADTMLAMNDLEGANKIYTAALQFNPNNAEVCYGAGRCFIQAKLVDDAKIMLEWALKLNPDFKEAKQALNDIK